MGSLFAGGIRHDIGPLSAPLVCALRAVALTACGKKEQAGIGDQAICRQASP